MQKKSSSEIFSINRKKNYENESHLVWFALVRLGLVWSGVSINKGFASNEKKINV